MTDYDTCRECGHYVCTHRPDNDAWLASEVFEGGDVGGDYQASESWAVQYENVTIPGAMITVYVYAEAGHDDRGIKTGEYFLSSQTEYITFTDREDVGGTEEWSEYEYDTETPLYGIDYSDGDAVAAMAKLIAADYAKKNDVFTWDGKPR